MFLDLFLVCVIAIVRAGQTYTAVDHSRFEVFDSGHLDHRPFIMTADDHDFEIIWLDFTLLVGEDAPDNVYQRMEEWAVDYYKKPFRPRPTRECSVLDYGEIGSYVCSTKYPIKIVDDLALKFHGLVRAAQFSRSRYKLISSACTVHDGERVCVSWTKNAEVDLTPAKYERLLSDCHVCLGVGDSCQYWVNSLEFDTTEVFCVSSIPNGCNPRLTC